MADYFERLIQARDSFNRGGSVRIEAKERVSALIVAFLDNEEQRYLAYSAKADAQDEYVEQPELPFPEGAGVIVDEPGVEGEEQA